MISINLTNDAAQNEAVAARAASLLTPAQLTSLKQYQAAQLEMQSAMLSQLQPTNKAPSRGP